MVKCLPTMRETWVRFLERELATHSSTLAWKIPWMEIVVAYSPWGHKSQTQLSDFTFSYGSGGGV